MRPRGINRPTPTSQTCTGMAIPIGSIKTPGTGHLIPPGMAIPINTQGCLMTPTHILATVTRGPHTSAGLHFAADPRTRRGSEAGTMSTGAGLQAGTGRQTTGRGSGTASTGRTMVQRRIMAPQRGRTCIMMRGTIRTCRL